MGQGGRVRELEKRFSVLCIQVRGVQGGRVGQGGRVREKVLRSVHTRVRSAHAQFLVTLNRDRSDQFSAASQPEYVNGKICIFLRKERINSQ